MWLQSDFITWQPQSQVQLKFQMKKWKQQLTRSIEMKDHRSVFHSKAVLLFAYTSFHRWKLLVELQVSRLWHSVLDLVDCSSYSFIWAILKINRHSLKWSLYVSHKCFHLEFHLRGCNGPGDLRSHGFLSQLRGGESCGLLSYQLAYDHLRPNSCGLCSWFCFFWPDSNRSVRCGLELANSLIFSVCL